MRRRGILATLILILALFLPAAVAAEDPPAPTTRFLFRVEGLPVAGAAEVVHQVNDFQPGQQTSFHTHPGLTMVSVLTGELTYRNPAGERVFKANESFFERPEVAHFARDARNAGTTPTRIVTSYVIAKGATLTTPQPTQPSPAPPPPTQPHLFRTDATLPTAPYEVAQAIIDFAPGAQGTTHTHPGLVVATVLEGALTHTAGGATRVYAVGESFTETPGVAAQARNAGAVRATMLVTYLLPKGAAPSAPVTTPAPPATGSGGNLPGLPNTGAGGGTDLPLGWLVLLACGALAAGGRLLRHRARRA